VPWSMISQLLRAFAYTHRVFWLERIERVCAKRSLQH
jgi:hypothetical protein